MKSSVWEGLAVCLALTIGAGHALAEESGDQEGTDEMVASEQGGEFDPRCFTKGYSMTCPIYSCFTDRENEISVCEIVGWKTHPIPIP